MPEQRPLVSDLAESEVLGEAIQYPEAVPQIIETLTSAMFASLAHGFVFEAIAELFKRGSAIDVVTVAEFLKANGRGQECGARLLADLLDGAPHGAHVADHVAIVRDLHALRQIRAACEETVSDLLEPSARTPAEILDRAEARLLELTVVRPRRSVTPLSESAPAALSRIRSRVESGELPGLATGFADLDEVTGGLKPGELILIAARPSMGKTSLVTAICRNAAARSGRHVVLFSLEQSEEELTERLLCTEARVDLAHVRRGACSSADLTKLDLASKRLGDVPFLIDDNPGVTILEIRATARRLAQQHDVALIAVDYLQLLGGRGENRVQEVSEISRGLKLLAKELRIPVIALSQLSRATEQRASRRPVLSDLRDSGSLEQDADVVMFLYRAEYYLGSEKAAEQGLIGACEVILAKQRNGPRTTVPLHFEERFTRFEAVVRGVAS